MQQQTNGNFWNFPSFCYFVSGIVERGGDTMAVLFQCSLACIGHGV